MELLAIAITATPQDLFKPTGEMDIDEFSKMTAALLDFIELRTPVSPKLCIHKKKVNRRSVNLWLSLEPARGVEPRAC